MRASATFAMWRRPAGKTGGEQPFSTAWPARDGAADRLPGASGPLFARRAEVVGCPQPHPDLPVPVRIVDNRGATVGSAAITIWVTRRK